MKARLTLLVCLIFCWQLPLAVWASAANDDSARKAEELYESSKTQTNYAQAATTAKQALALFQSTKDVAGQLKTHELLGNLYYGQTMMTEAAKHFELGLKLARATSDLKKEVHFLCMLGFTEARNGEWLNGVSYLTQAHNLSDDGPYYPGLARVAAGMGYIFNENGLRENALVQYKKAIEYYRLAEDTPNQYRQLMHLGETYFHLKDYSAALTHLREATAHFESLPDDDSKLHAAECHEYLGQIYLALAQYHLAQQHFGPLQDLYSQTRHDADAANVKAWMGQVYEKLGEPQRAYANYVEAAQVFRNVDDRVRDAAVRFALGRLELDRNNYDAAEMHLQESIKTTEEIRSDLKSRVFAAGFSASVHERYEAYIDCLLKKDRQGFAARAFEASEMARARSLAELLRDTQTKVVSGVDPQLIAQERTLRQAIRAKVEESITLLAGESKKEQFDELESSLTRLREQHRRVVQELRKQNPHFDQIKEPASYSLQQIQEQVIDDDQTTLLEYFLGKNASYVWVVTRKDIKVFELKKSDEITSAVRVVYELLRTGPKSDTAKSLTEATAQLAQMVLGPLANELNGRRLIVVADGALNYIPFQLLPGMSNSRPLVENYEIVNAPSASILGQLRHEKQQRQPRTKILAAFGDPVFPENYAQFKRSGTAVASANGPASRDIEVQGDTLDPAKIQSLFYSKFELNDLNEIAGSSSLINRGFDASRAVFEKTDFSKYAILHIATHAVLDTKVPEKSGFYLSMVDPANQPQPEGFITMQDIYGLQVPVDLVVLSACRTGLGKEVSGEGLIGLTRGFMHAGASSVVSSLWKVDDEATATLMKSFYANMLQKGMRPAEALRAAQNTLRQNPHWQAPHFWAGFTLQGEFKEPLRLPQPSGASRAVQNGVGLGLLLTLLAGIAWGFYRRRSVSIR